MEWTPRDKHRTLTPPRRKLHLAACAFRTSPAVTIAMTIVMIITGGCALTPIKPEPVYFPAPPASAHVVHVRSFNSIDGIVAPKRDWIDLFRGRGSAAVETPAGLACDERYLYVCDTGSNVVHRWNLDDGSGTWLGSEGDDGLLKPVAVATDGQGAAFVADAGGSAIVWFSADGTVVAKLRPPDRDRYQPVALALDGTTLYAADLASHQIDMFSATDGAHLGSFGGIGSQPGQFYFPTGVATDGLGSVFVSDMMNARVQCFDAGRRPARTIGQPGDRYGDLGQPKHLAVGPDRTLFVADAQFGHVHLFDEQGRLLMLLGGPDLKLGGTPLPCGVAVAKNLPEPLTRLVPADFDAGYFVFVSNGVGLKRISLYAVGTTRVPGSVKSSKGRRRLAGRPLHVVRQTVARCRGATESRGACALSLRAASVLRGRGQPSYPPWLPRT